ncbi:hypothetical protein SBV1_790002 [Verrucomicrobia bacterium]|nr:hypothetical protein SBV1_790002 [Verrucomicrobiota bacterium]
MPVGPSSPWAGYFTLVSNVRRTTVQPDISPEGLVFLGNAPVTFCAL